MKKKKQKPSILKETKEERAERIRMWRTTVTRVVPNKKKVAERKLSRGAVEV